MSANGTTLAAILAPEMFQLWRLRGRDCAVTIYPRPAYCNRGNYHALFDGTGATISGADPWPRYYFDLARAMAELEALIDKRQLRVAGEQWTRYQLTRDGREVDGETLNTTEGGER